MPDGITVEINGFQQAAKAALDQFANATYADIQAATDKTAKEVVKRTRTASPTKSGVYRKGWTSKVVSDNSRTYQRTVHNKNKGYLTHLLEHGHGGPHPAKAHPHITTDEETRQIFEQALKKEMEGS